MYLALALVLEHERGDEPLDFGRLLDSLAVLLEFTAHHVLAHCW